jgi:hypothetical protein
MITPKTALIFILIALALGLGFYIMYPTPEHYDNPKEPLACTMEAMQCPDGSYVGRDSENNCEFKPCPNNLPPGSQMEDGTISTTTNANQ